SAETQKVDSPTNSPAVAQTGSQGTVATGAPGVPSTNEATRPGVAMSPAANDTVPINPLVTAYAESLAAHGYDAGNQGFIVATLKGEVLAEHNADRLFNPASVTKIATSLTAISRLGPDFTFRTSLYTDGKL